MIISKQPWKRDQKREDTNKQRGYDTGMLQTGKRKQIAATTKYRIGYKERDRIIKGRKKREEMMYCDQLSARREQFAGATARASQQFAAVDRRGDAKRADGRQTHSVMSHTRNNVLSHVFTPVIEEKAVAGVLKVD